MWDEMCQTETNASATVPMVDLHYCIYLIYFHTTIDQESYLYRSQKMIETIASNQCYVYKIEGCQF